MSKDDHEPPSFGSEIRRRRETLGWTLEELAPKASRTPNYIGTIERDKRDPSLSTILALARAFGVKPGELFPPEDMSPAGYQAGRFYDDAPRDIQTILLALIRAIAVGVKRTRKQGR